MTEHSGTERDDMTGAESEHSRRKKAASEGRPASERDPDEPRDPDAGGATTENHEPAQDEESGPQRS